MGCCFQYGAGIHGGSSRRSIRAAAVAAAVAAAAAAAACKNPITALLQTVHSTSCCTAISQQWPTFGEECRFPHSSSPNSESSCAVSGGEETGHAERETVCNRFDIDEMPVVTAPCISDARISDVSASSLSPSIFDKSSVLSASECQIIWCDKRAFKDTEETRDFKEQ